jgi:hypothetical protein
MQRADAVRPHNVLTGDNHGNRTINDMKKMMPLTLAVSLLTLALIGQARTDVSATAPACSGTNGIACSGTNTLLFGCVGTNSDCCTMTNVTLACDGGTNLFLARN